MLDDFSLELVSEVGSSFPLIISTLVCIYMLPSLTPHNDPSFKLDGVYEWGLT